jgi:TPR repeat protein
VQQPASTQIPGWHRQKELEAIKDPLVLERQMKNRFEALSIVAMVLVAATAQICSPTPAFAQTSRSTGVDKWGLSTQDWQKLPGYEMLEKAGGPGRLPELLQAAKNRDAKAMVLAGLAYANEQVNGVFISEAEALRWFQAAAKAGNPMGMFFFGARLADGNGAPQNEVEAVRWFRTAATAGHARSMFNLGLMLEQGRGAAKNETEAARWYRTAADAGNENGMFNLGVMLFNGRGVAKNEAEAARWYRTAAEAGHGASMFYLGVMFLEGKGVAKDPIETKRWWRAAAALGDEVGDQAATSLRQEFGIRCARTASGYQCPE